MKKKKWKEWKFPSDNENPMKANENPPSGHIHSRRNPFLGS